MKTLRSLLPCLFLLSSVVAQVQDESAKELLRDGLFEEEANQDFKKAEVAYRKLIERYDAERRYAGTALFRLAEMARKEKKSDEAATLYRRVITEFFDQTEIAQRAQGVLGQLGKGVPPAPQGPGAVGQTAARGQVVLGKEKEELHRLFDLKNSSPDLLDGLDQSGQYPLHRAASEGWMHVIDFLLAENVTIDPRTSGTGMTPLHLAVAQGRLDVVKRLLEAGADHSASFIAAAEDLPVPPPAPLKTAGGRWSTMHLAVAYDRRSVAAALLEAGASPSEDGVYAKSSGGRRRDYVNPLLLAMQLRASPMVEFLLEKGVDLNQVTKQESRTALTYALGSWPEQVVRLLDLGADPNLGERDGYKAIHLAIQSGEAAFVERLLKAGADPEEVSTGGQSALEIAAGSDPKMVSLLLEAGAKPNSRALVMAVQWGKLEQVKLLVAADQKGEVVNDQGEHGMPALDYAQTKEIAEVLVNGGAEVNAKTVEGQTALDLVVDREDTPESRALFEYLVAQGGEAPSLLGELVEKENSAPTGAVLGRGSSFRESLSATMRTLLPYALERLVYPEFARPDAVRLVYLNERRLFDGETRVIEGTPAPTVSELVGSHPELRGDLARIRVLRKEGDAFREAVSIGRVEIANAQIPELRWGDVVEITRENSDSDGWLRKAMFDYAPRTVTFKMGPWEEKVRIEPDESIRSTRAAYSLFLDRHLRKSSRVFDLRKVKIHREEAAPLELDVTQGDGPPHLRLVDGDVIEVPLLPKAEEGARSWDGIVMIHPDRPVVEVPPSPSRDRAGRVGLFGVLKNARNWSGGRDLSKIEIRRADGSRVEVDLLDIMNKYPQYEWTVEKLAEFDVKLGEGDLVILHPEREVAWGTRVGSFSLRDSKLEAFLRLLFPEGEGAGSTGAGAPATPTQKARSAPNSRPRRVVLPPTR